MATRRDSGPAVLRFQARLVPESKAAKAASDLALTIPPAVSKKLTGMNGVEGTINDHPFRGALRPNGSAGYTLRVNRAMREGAGAKAGDTVKLAILGPEPPPKATADLRGPLAADRDASALWKSLPAEVQRDWIRWIEGAKTPETRARRVRRTVEQLSEGKRRPCCVNFYEYMLQRVRKT